MSLELRNFSVKVKISALWILLGFSLTLDFTLKDFDPGSSGLAQTLATISPQQLSPILLGDAFIRVVPFVFAFLSLTLVDGWNRRMNLGLGLVFTVFALFGLADFLSRLTYSTSYGLVTQSAAIAASILIFWYAFRWRKEAQRLGA